jgi:hypothetical protein
MQEFTPDDRCIQSDDKADRKIRRKKTRLAEPGFELSAVLVLPQQILSLDSLNTGVPAMASRASALRPTINLYPTNASNRHPLTIRSTSQQLLVKIRDFKR